MRSLLPLLFAGVSLAALASHSGVPSITPVPGDADPNSAWMKGHLERVEKAKSGGSEVVFLGDSITRGGETSGASTFSIRRTGLSTWEVLETGPSMSSGASTTESLTDSKPRRWC